jgi:peroxisomal 2,4-dienoyl-CoA reductase
MIIPLVTVIAPGPIGDTEGYNRLSAGTPEDMQKAMQMRVPLGRDGAVSDIANASVFLFSEAANWITGQIIVSIFTTGTRWSAYILW